MNSEFYTPPASSGVGNGGKSTTGTTNSSGNIPESKDGTHGYVKTNGDKREYHGFDVYNGDGKGYIN